MTIDCSAFRVVPDDEVDLSARPTQVKAYYHSPNDYRRRIQAHIAALTGQQNLLYSNNTHSLLLIFQGMDSAGKDGCIKHVMLLTAPDDRADRDAGRSAPHHRRLSAALADRGVLQSAEDRLPHRGPADGEHADNAVRPRAAHSRGVAPAAASGDSGRSAGHEVEKSADAAGIQTAQPASQEGEARAGRDGGSVHRGDCQDGRAPAAQRSAWVANATCWMAVAAGYGAWRKAFAGGFDQ